MILRACLIKNKQSRTAAHTDAISVQITFCIFNRTLFVHCLIKICRPLCVGSTLLFWALWCARVCDFGSVRPCSSAETALKPSITFLAKHKSALNRRKFSNFRVKKPAADSGATRVLCFNDDGPLHFRF